MTNLTHPEIPHLILGPYTTGTGGNLTPCMLVNVNSSGELSIHTTKVRPDGVIIMDPNYNWGSTTPALDATLPDNIEVYICAYGPCLINMDVSKVIDAAYYNSIVYESDEPGHCAIASRAAPTVIGEAGHFPVGTLMDLLAGNTGSGTGGADGDLAEVFFGKVDGAVVVSSA